MTQDDINKQKNQENIDRQMKPQKSFKGQWRPTHKELEEICKKSDEIILSMTSDDLNDFIE